MQFVLQNMTTIENLSHKSKVWQMAVIIPPGSTLSNGTPQTGDYPKVTYPIPASSGSNVIPGTARSEPSVEYGVSGPPGSAAGQDCTADTSESRALVTAPNPQQVRDAQAVRRFAIVRTEPGDNPWDLGTYNNFKSVMGNNFFEWILPIKRSPCCSHDDMTSQFQTGPAVAALRTRHGLMPAGAGIDLKARRGKGEGKYPRHTKPEIGAGTQDGVQLDNFKGALEDRERPGGDQVVR
jgi:palmitoyltransferase